MQILEFAKDKSVEFARAKISKLCLGKSHHWSPNFVARAKSSLKSQNFVGGKIITEFSKLCSMQSHHRSLQTLPREKSSPNSSKFSHCKVIIDVSKLWRWQSHHRILKTLLAAKSPILQIDLRQILQVWRWQITLWHYNRKVVTTTLYEAASTWGTYGYAPLIKPKLELRKSK